MNEKVGLRGKSEKLLHAFWTDRGGRLGFGGYLLTPYLFDIDTQCIYGVDGTYRAFRALNLEC